MDTGTLTLQLSYALLLLAAITSRRLPRLFLGLSAAVALTHALVWSGDAATIAWMALVLAACAVVLGRDLIATMGARFSADEEAMLAGFLSGVPRHLARHLIDRGVWVNGSIGDEITREGERVERLVFLGSGEALVISDGRQVATCRPGDLIGDATILTREPATATVMLAGPARFWCVGADDFRAYLAANPELAGLMERSFARTVRAKLHASNRTIAAAGGVA
ncbi:cyclic nucleotide-binding domain-containing protein [Sphingomonas canadensis]|uniref:Cyclic nucleotide-binding domain-containing protein n=1 Tax=Sphingomonas canadensis TaxID=1219257 RepID=A0ABW3HCD9_9SPHN|nr:cyclic nucleotide-binding domain-containing protein [Sphingomonas canadensis]MCW3836699.1 cyclic nucleotide-binding domain-containing protein [Sphingomonas canadensis]